VFPPWAKSFDKRSYAERWARDIAVGGFLPPARPNTLASSLREPAPTNQIDRLLDSYIPILR
jgi:hypothetical protein